jgi:hypothetical protein
VRAPRPRQLLLAVAAILLAAAAGEFWINGSYGIAAPWDTPHFIKACGLEYDYVSSAGDQVTAGLVVSPIILSVPLPLFGVVANSTGGYGGCPSLITLRLPSGNAFYRPSIAP